MGNCFCKPATVPSGPEPTSTPPAPKPPPRGIKPPPETETPCPPKIAQTIHQTPKSSLDVSPSTVVPSSHGRSEKNGRAAFRDKGETVTVSASSFQLHATTPRRVLSEDWGSSKLHGGGTDTGYLPPIGGALAPQDPRRQETVPHAARSPSSAARMNRIISDNGLGTGRTPRFGPYLTPGGPTSVEGKQEGRPRFTSTLQSLLANHRFRILVVGKRGSGKSSLIKSIFKVDMSGSPINISGRTAEFRPPDNQHLIVHECSAFGPGEMQAIREFIIKHNHEGCPASERLHAIWICVPMSDVIDGQFDEGVKLLLDVGVPLVLVFTKLDLIVPKVPSTTAGGNDYKRVRAAYTAHEGSCRSLFRDVPAEIISTRPKFRDLIDKLVKTTDRLILAHPHKIAAPSEAQQPQPRMSLIPLAWSVSQRASRDINILTAIEVGRSKYWRGLWSTDNFHGQTLASCIEVIHADIVGVWNLPNRDRYLSSKPFREEISYLVQDLSGSPTSAPSRPTTGPAWLNNRYENSKEKICLVVGYIVDLTLILCGVFKSPGNVSPGEVQSAINNFAGSSLNSVHNDISRFITTVPELQYHNNDVVMAKIKDLISGNCDPSPR